MDGVRDGLREICLSAAGGARSAASLGRPKSRTAVARSGSLHPHRRGHSSGNGLGRLRGAPSQTSTRADGREQDERKASLLYNVIFQCALGVGAERPYAIEPVADAAWRVYRLWSAVALGLARVTPGDHLARLRRHKPRRSAWTCVLELSVQCAWLSNRGRSRRQWNRLRHGQMPDSELFSWRGGNRSVFRILVQPRLCACRTLVVHCSWPKPAAP